MTVALQGARDTGWVNLTVSDTGLGIPADRLDKIFDRYYQVNHSGDHPEGGAGLGLALTKELVERHHGEISVTSEAGKGTTVVVRLPLGSAHFTADQVDDTPAVRAQLRHHKTELCAFEPWKNDSPLPCEPGQAGARRAHERLLIVEDNPDMRAYVRGCLPNYRILEAENGAAGLRLACKTLPDLIVSDVMMPEMDGLVFCDKIKSDKRTSHIPVVLLTARASQQDKLQGLETGADSYLTKPFDARELQVRIKNLIEQRQLAVEPSEYAHRTTE